MSGFVNQVDLIKVCNLFNTFFHQIDEKKYLFFIDLGKGIYLVRDIEGLKKKFAEIDAMDKKKQVSIKPMKRIIQRFSFSLIIVFSED